MLLALSLLLACTDADTDATPGGDDSTDPDTTADGGDSGGDADPITTDLTFYEDVSPIMQHSCLGCHAEGGLGGIALDSFEAVKTWALPIEVAVSERTMPPWGASGDCNTYQNDFSLSDEEIDTLVEWLQGGMPAGDPASAPEPVAPWEAPVLERVDLTLSMEAPYTPTASPDDYRCFLMEWPYEEEVWVTGFQFAPGNTDVVHHVIPFIISPDDAADYKALDDADPGAGYTCYGGPGGDIDTLIRTKWLGAWAPGTGATTLPEGTGIDIDPGSLIAMQVHYYTGGGGTGADQTALELMIEEERQGWSDVQPWTDVAWVLGLGMDIPAGSTGVQHQFSYTVSEGEGTFAMYGAALHMHRLGQQATLKVKHADGSESCVVDVPSYDFNWQRSYGLVEPVTISPGDTVELTCSWDNPTDEDVKWGDGTGDEMCLGISLIAGAP